MRGFAAGAIGSIMHVVRVEADIVSAHTRPYRIGWMCLRSAGISFGVVTLLLCAVIALADDSEQQARIVQPRNASVCQSRPDSSRNRRKVPAQKQTQSAGGQSTQQVEILRIGASSDASRARARSDVRIIMYSTRWCGVCAKARRYFKENGIRVAEYDVDRDRTARARHRQLNPSGSVPTFEIDDVVITGFSKDYFEQALDTATSRRVERSKSRGPKIIEVTPR